MRIASGIISLVLGFAVLFQSCAVAGLGSIVDPDSTIGAVGMLVGFLLLSSGAFSFQLPKVSVVICIIAALFAGIEAMNEFPDMKVWAVLCLILAAMNYFGARKPKEPISKDPPTPSP
ncbi:MAG: hypothetical protein PHV50_02175 [Syntrophaceticus sp.]|nr:hypothetical protein [Syntrophaceticus sp.]